MAINTRTPRTSNGTRKAAKTVRVSRQGGANERNKAALFDLKAEGFPVRTDVRPSKARRKAEREKARREAAVNAEN